MSKSDAGRFWLYDLKVETVLGDRTAVCRHVEGESFLVEGENLVFSADHKLSLYALAGCGFAAATRQTA